MPVETNKEFVRRYYAVDLRQYKEIMAQHKENDWYAPGFTAHATTKANMNMGEFQQSMGDLFNAFPDFRFDVVDMVGEGDKVAVRYTFNGTHSNPYMGILASGKKVKVEGIGISRLTGGKIAENWFVTDILGLMTQIGAMPGTAPKK